MMTGKAPYHTLQRERECTLAAVCFAKGLNYVEISNLFRARYGESWQSLKEHRIDLAYAFLIELGVRGTWFTESAPAFKSIDLSGRGVFTICFSRGGGRHAVAYKDGVIYDSDKLYPMPWNEWRKRTARHIIDGQERFK